MCRSILNVSQTAYNASWLYYLLDQGTFTANRALHSTLTVLWAAVQFLLPAAILLFCTRRLLRALRESRRIQRRYRTFIRATTGVVTSGADSQRGRRLTVVLVAIVISFLVLVTPSELLHLCYYVVRHDNALSFELALVVANMLQTANFALNFLLYCTCNSQFRDTWKHPSTLRNRCAAVHLTDTGRCMAAHRFFESLDVSMCLETESCKCMTSVTAIFRRTGASR